MVTKNPNNDASMPTCVSPSQFSDRELAWAKAAVNASAGESPVVVAQRAPLELLA